MFKFQISSCVKLLFQRSNFSKIRVNCPRTFTGIKQDHINHVFEENTQEEEDIFLDLEKEQYLLDLKEHNSASYERFFGLNLERGKKGVFDIEDLVKALRKENSENVFVAGVPKEINYVDFIVVVSGRSQKHMQAIAQFIRRLYKQKRYQGDILPKIEGEDSKDWIAMDLGNIALHIFSSKARKIYDLDTLWTVGPKYDEECNKKEAVSEMLQKYSSQLAEFQPAS